MYVYIMAGGSTAYLRRFVVSSLKWMWNMQVQTQLFPPLLDSYTVTPCVTSTYATKGDISFNETFLQNC